MMMANELISQEAMTTSIPSMSYHERSNDSYSFDVVRGGCIAREQVTWWHHCKMRGRNNQTLYMLLVARITATSTVDYKDDGNVRTLCCIARSNNNEWWLIATKARVPSNNQPNFTLHCRSEQQLQNEIIVKVMITSYIVLQEATMPATTVDRNKRAGLHQWQPTLFLDLDQPHWQSQKCKVPVVMLIMRTWWQNWWRNNHFYVVLQ